MKHRIQIVAGIAGLLVVAIAWISGCGTRNLDQQHLAIRLHSRWEFLSNILWIEVTDSTRNRAVEYTLQIGIESRGIVVAGVQLVKERLLLSSLDGSSMGYGSIRFDPPIPILPNSLNVGDSQTWETMETHYGDSNQRYKVRIRTTVLESSPVEAAYATFDDVLRIGIDYAYEDPSTTPFLAGESEWWFARGVGIIRYELGWGPYIDVVTYGKVQY
jgi:hypothetical protein